MNIPDLLELEKEIKNLSLMIEEAKEKCESTYFGDIHGTKIHATLKASYKVMKYKVDKILKP